jgi:hypothetical protein
VAAARAKAATYRSWPRRQRRLAVEIVVLSVALEGLLRVVPYGKLIPVWARLARSRGARRLVTGGNVVGTDQRRAVVWAATNLVRPGRACLPRALLQWARLLADDVDARLVIGTRLSPEFQAHAWVEVGGEPVAGDRAGVKAFTPLVAWDAAGRPRPVSPAGPGA